MSGWRGGKRTESARPCISSDETFFGKTKVGQNDVTFMSQEKVLEFLVVVCFFVLFFVSGRTWGGREYREKE